MTFLLAHTHLFLPYPTIAVFLKRFECLRRDDRLLHAGCVPDGRQQLLPAAVPLAGEYLEGCVIPTGRMDSDLSGNQPGLSICASGEAADVSSQMALNRTSYSVVKSFVGELLVA